MRIILLESLNKLGKAGEIITVKDGYANNFLIPGKKAIIANNKNKAELEGKMVEINSNNQKRIEEAELLKSKLDGKSVNISMEANDEGNLYGSITQRQIIDGLSSQGINIKSDMIILNQIKSLGEFEIGIRLYEEIESLIKVIVSKKS
jgi:large subunit ribosomal protein L9